MTKVYPNTASEGKKPASDGHVAILTVWRKSLLFNCNGFTVFDAKGNLVFRVDNYVSSNKGEILLMDAAGKPLLTIRRKRLSLGEHWLVYEGETAVNPRLSVKKHVSFLQSKALAHVNSCSTESSKNATYEIEGSYSQRSCVVYDGTRRPMAEIKRKEAAGGIGFGVDVFRLIVQPEFDSAVAMAFVILLEQMYGSDRLMKRVRI